MDGGELLARLHSVISDRGMRHELEPPDERCVARVTRVADQALGPASPAFDLAHWWVAAGDDLHDRSDLLRLGYARVADPDAADAGWLSAFAIHFALEVLGWRNPAPPPRLRRCVDVIARYAAA
jgi:hypothetical protein